jgi:hypothetical protein
MAESRGSWIEITNRRDIGANLNAPAGDKNGAPHWSYDLVRQVRAGDLVYHYDTNRRAIVGRSVAVGEAWPDKVVWAARGTRSRGIEPHLQDGWYLGLERYAALPNPLTANELASKQVELFALRDRLAATQKDAVRFPFIPYRPGEVRAFQAYLTRFPGELHGLFPQLNSLGDEPEITTQSVDLGTAYRPADDATSVGERDPFEVDPALVERALRGHASTQNALAEYVRSRGAAPRSPAPSEPNFDLAWLDGDTAFVAEVKSRTDANEERQLRLGLGQVLRYCQVLERAHKGRTVKAVLAVESAPRDASWRALCAKLGVLLVWPPGFETLEK